MSALVFEARWHRIQRSREQGFEELSDFLGRYASFGPLVRLGLLRKREERSEFQRYHGYVPTAKGDQFLLYIPEKELVLVRPGKSPALFNALKLDPAPSAPFKETYTEPTRSQFDAIAEMRANAGRDLWRIHRAEHLVDRLLQGYMDIRAFTKRTGIGDGSLLRAELVRTCERTSDHGLILEPTEDGQRFLEVLDEWELMLVKPGMELPLFERCDPEAASYWCGLP